MKPNQDNYSADDVTRGSLHIQTGALNHEGVLKPFLNGTAFFVDWLGLHLVTCKHLVTHQSPETGDFITRIGVPPEVIAIKLPAEGPDLWKIHHIDLSTHRLRKFGNADVVAIPIELPDWVDRSSLFVHDFEERQLEPRPVYGTTDDVYIIGYPYGFEFEDGLTLWTRATVASAVKTSNQASTILVDARTREGNSGSPVVVYRNQGSLRYSDGSLRLVEKPTSQLIGVYSGRLGEKTDIGRVWTIKTLQSLFDMGDFSPAPESEKPFGFGLSSSS